MSNSYNILDQAVSGGALMRYLYTGASKSLMSRHFSSFTDTENVVIADRLYLQPYLLEFSGQADALRVEVRAALAGIARCGIWNVNSSGAPSGLLATTGDIDISTANLKTATFSAVSLTPGWYFVGIICSAAITMQTTSPAVYGESFLGRLSSGLFPASMLYSTVAAGWTTLPAIPTITGVMSIYDGSVPMISARFV